MAGEQDWVPGPPEVDERLIVPERRYEVVDGEVRYVSPSEEPHGDRHSKLQALLEAHVGDDYNVACDMLTRTGAKSDFAPDASVYPTARDPKTGGRQLEELAFEVVSTQTLNRAGGKAQALQGRGVRRVFAIDVKRRRCLEWSSETGSWQILGPDGSIADATLTVPLRVRDLVSAGKADDSVARALLAKKNPVLVAALDAREAQGLARGEARGLAQGEAQGLAQGEARGLARGEAQGLARGEAQGLVAGILAVLASRAVPVSDEERLALAEIADVERLRRLLAAAVTSESVAELLARDP
ncbi:MAG: Uma2 family endonuclease [Myxococcota bacterium]